MEIGLSLSQCENIIGQNYTAVFHIQALDQRFK
jgi:hypothetical protein